ncbi:MAG: hypothetical protein JWR51_1207 [Devosia sp.]|uniref:DUF6894 family protein n=1 Tax=Devosia sp. TaxID=1871048 RepID=UPI0026289AFA|nr:hypothetical protein [Devosia sp.]MDB5528104.1 hypothetical protein [Devosia sp.]
MPRYYFDIREGQETVTDDEGTELVDLTMARLEAANTITELANDHIPGDGPQHYISIIVRDETGAAVIKMDLAFDTKVLI